MSSDKFQREITIYAPARLLYDIVTDYERYPEIFEAFESVIVLDRDEDGLTVKFTARFVIQIVYTQRIKLDAERLTASWALVDGDLKESSGSWRFEQLPSGDTQVFYEMSASIGFFVPKAASNLLIARSMPKTFAALEAEACRRLERQAQQAASSPRREGG